ncbi:hypothetical protein GCM10010528_25360 [Gordonia defluvii]|uniref:Uncharacterized protein n=1 Tax=Gordonia defluvii TaxID=283718 RepID=A0ABP6LMJ5_9ACTN
MDDDETMTEAEIDELFARTQPIGNAINALYRAEQIIAEAVADSLSPEVPARIDQVIADVRDTIHRAPED